LKFRFAKNTDKEDVLKFCINTFDWGDYIDQVWDLWYSESNSALIVAENEIHHTKKSVIAVSHVSLCPNRRNIWLEGIRVNPDYRRRSIATELLSKMLSYGKRQGAKEASAIVGVNNLPSQLMMEKNGFDVISKWNYYNTNKSRRYGKVNVRTATVSDIKNVWDYLKQSKIYKSSGKRHVNSWRWYSFDSDTILTNIKDGKLLIAGNDDIEGIAIINKDGYWNRNDVFQIVYLDAASISSLYDLIVFVIMLVHSDNDRYKRIQIFSPQIRQMSSLTKELDIDNSEQFLLYRKII
jgi:N-acetylglutamate synthase-like GNAT family acetyltransferase